ncbi:hypothetical protein QTH51_05030 [Clostridium perfringens]|nr:hypothetical protein [Clostridium perfringens]
MELLKGQMSIFDLKQESEKSFDFIILVYKSVGSYKYYRLVDIKALNVNVVGQIKFI